MPFELCCRNNRNTNINNNNNVYGDEQELICNPKQDKKNINNKEDIEIVINKSIKTEKPNKTKENEKKQKELRAGFDRIVKSITTGGWKPGNSKDLGTIQANLKLLVARYDKAMVECERSISNVYTRTRDITPDIRKQIVKIQDEAFEPLMQDIVKKAVVYLQRHLETVSYGDEGGVKNMPYQFSKGFLTSAGFGSKQFAYLFATVALQNIGASVGSTTLGIRSDLLWARVVDSAYIGPVHYWLKSYADQAVSKFKGEPDPSVTRPLPQGNHNLTMHLAQRMMGFDLPLAAMFWMCYHVKGLVDDLSGNVHPVTLAATGAAASMVAGGLTALLSEFSYKTMALVQMKNLQQNMPSQDSKEIKQEFLDMIKGANYEILVSKNKVPESSPFFMVTKVISSIIGSLIMLYYLNMPVVSSDQTSAPTGAPTMMPDEPTTSHWSSDSQFVRTGLAMACYLIGWCLFRPILEELLSAPSTDTKFNERIDKVRDVFTSKNDENIFSDDDNKEVEYQNIITPNKNTLSNRKSKINHKNNPNNSIFNTPFIVQKNNNDSDSISTEL